jgi:protein subunit release factor A
MGRYDDTHVEQLIVAAGTLATVTDQAAVLLSEEFDSLVRPSVDNVRAILAMMPPAEEEAMLEADGSLREQDLEFTYTDSPNTTVQHGKVGVHILHRPTGIGRESNSKSSQLQNQEVALKALTQAVRKELARRAH